MAFRKTQGKISYRKQIGYINFQGWNKKNNRKVIYNKESDSVNVY